MAVIDYYFTSLSPFAYLGHRAVEAVARRHGAAIAYKPVDLAVLFKASGAVPLAQRTAARRAYRLIELERWAMFRGLPIILEPRHFPVDPRLADQATIALLAARLDPSDFMFRIFSAVWAREENISDPGVIEACLEACGFDGGRLLSEAQDPAIAARRSHNSEEAVAAGAMGSPTYVLNGEPFWGQDRIELLDGALETGRAAVTGRGRTEGGISS